jgi:hypothetical protein
MGHIWRLSLTEEKDASLHLPDIQPSVSQQLIAYRSKSWRQ